MHKTQLRQWATCMALRVHSRLGSCPTLALKPPDSCWHCETKPITSSRHISPKAPIRSIAVSPQYTPFIRRYSEAQYSCNGTQYFTSNASTLKVNRTKTTNQYSGHSIELMLTVTECSYHKLSHLTSFHLNWMAVEQPHSLWLRKIITQQVEQPKCSDYGKYKSPSNKAVLTGYRMCSHSKLGQLTAIHLSNSWGQLRWGRVRWGKV